MSARIIDGLAITRDLRPAIRARAAALTAQEMTPGLAVILVGDHPASRIYVRNKVRACAEVGIRSQVIEFPDSIAEAELLACVQSLNEDSTRIWLERFIFPDCSEHGACHCRRSWLRMFRQSLLGFYWSVCPARIRV